LRRGEGGERIFEVFASRERGERFWRIWRESEREGRKKLWR
jgi:hypothetical protein